MRAQPNVTGLAPGRIAFARVLYVVGGFVAVVNGVIELGPDVGRTAHAIGILLVVGGVAAWWLAWVLRTPKRWLGTAAVVVTLVLIGIRAAQYEFVKSPLVLTACVLPVVAAWCVVRRPSREWLSISSDAWADAISGERQRRRAMSTLRRLMAVTGVVGLTAGILVVVTGLAVTTAVSPCTFPPVSTAALGIGSIQTREHVTPTGSISATDGVKLAYYAFIPAHPVASLVFYHGSGANSAAGYLPMGQELAAQYNVATYLFDIRGHGVSGGPRGDAPSTLQLESDTESAVVFVHKAQAGVPEFVGGHSAGAGLVLNSIPIITRNVAGYAFLAPDFGLHSGTELDNHASNFATLCLRPLVATVLTNGILGAHEPAVAFAYTPQQVRTAGLVATYTATMAIGQDASDSAATLAGLDHPLGVWIGTKDEVFNAEKVLAYAHKATKTAVTTGLAPGASHLGILDDGASRIGSWIDRLATHH